MGAPGFDKYNRLCHTVVWCGVWHDILNGCRFNVMRNVVGRTVSIQVIAVLISVCRQLMAQRPSWHPQNTLIAVVGETCMGYPSFMLCAVPFSLCACYLIVLQGANERQSPAAEPLTD